MLLLKRKAAEWLFQMQEKWHLHQDLVAQFFFIKSA